ncbi:SUPPRESSOR OF ABI3-5-like isoform X1 [Macadamia integrifolia]|uniref:SUPPRESSOR OF ABI3-5-like isoform X1 n=1 Tax=Macadamia integrifolia TaxID=60698 RepID=UPI001C4FFB63|nr:SUPPRESSOR OF ABI3-5-like isoform X1 [Macadamia integrifolia]XP_042504624.1 SUPPRESSOR OF ABI3-5-like isoform X1 [Macadamia integrifolia]XP_042504625.1 SUPPRESSOR OF ABI3-5-like isoform X1 [Macadamia integrifolia]XP_042504626.1 SUPPRESSOR OF ABI3-5-like isoform X1 [Macadamia integrifolia]XP_042504627.1 SUPPRESSOR OF ABI3-5-like isoform X1 [Macadamia integrifolia]XP_042504629.1 SUPPRESSOR OF ABI3-5-like isoform X1 [Macadamia integrifolia]XP_042504630.1 SUPPRESSOR OF ABI3-5-like isoform X1 [
MDPGRYILHQGWDNNSASEGYGPLHEPDYRVGGSYDGRRFLDEGFSRDNIYPRGSYHRDIVERDNYPTQQSVVGVWPQQSFDEEYALIREPKRHEKPYIDGFREAAKYREIDRFQDGYRGVDSYHNVDSCHDYGFDRPARLGGQDRDEFAADDYDHRHRISYQSRGDSHEKGRYSYDSDYDRASRRDGSWRKRDSRDRDRDHDMRSRERDQSPHRRHERSRSRSHGHDDRLRSRSRSPRSRIHSRSHREDSYDDNQHERGEKRRDRDGKRLLDHSSAAPSATLVVKGLSQKTTEEDLYQILAEWGPIRHVRVIKERNSGISRGFAFIDFPSVGEARKMVDGIGDDGLVVDGRKLFFEYSSKPTTGAGGPPYGQENAVKSRSHQIAPPSDWMCTICNCVNFARRTSCFQCNEPRTDDAAAADVASSNPTQLGRKGSEAGPTHVLVVRGLDENADEEMLRYEFSKHAPIKDLRLVRDKFTHVSRGFAFVHFHSVEDATKALEATNGTTLEKNGQILRVAYAKSIHGPGLGASGASQSSSLAAAAIEAATFAQQYDAVGWAPKEYNPDDKQSTSGQEQGSSDGGQKDGSAPQSGFVWDEASGYYYDATSGFYYDGNTGLYYDSSNGTWYSYDQQTQQYVPCGDQNDKTSGKAANEPKASDSASNRKVVISAPAATITLNEKSASLPDAVQAAASAALAAEKKEKEKMKEIRVASKSNILANKKKMSNVLSMWKQRNNAGQAARIVLDDTQPSGSMDDRPKNKFRSDSMSAKENTSASLGFPSAVVGRGASNTLTTPITAQTASAVSEIGPQPVRNSSGGTLMGVIRGSGRGVMKSDATLSGRPFSSSPAITNIAATSAVNPETPAIQTPFRTDVSALGSYTPPATGSGKRRFSEKPASSHREQPQTTYRDRAAERRSLYGSSSIGDGFADSSKHA